MPKQIINNTDNYTEEGKKSAFLRVFDPKELELYRLKEDDTPVTRASLLREIEAISSQVTNVVNTTQRYYNTTNTTTTAGGAKTATFVIGPSSNDDSDTYDYTTDGTNDNVQIQAALDDLPSGGGCIFFREGTYTLGSTISWPSKTAIMLKGTGESTVITCKSAFDVDFFDMPNSVTIDTIIVEDIKFDGNYTNQTSTSMMVFDLSNTGTTVGTFAVNRCTFYNIPNEINDTDTSIDYISFTNCIIENWGCVSDSIAIQATYLSNSRFSNPLALSTHTTCQACNVERVTECTFGFGSSFNNIGVNADYAISNTITVGSSAGSSCIALKMDGQRYAVANRISIGSSADVGARGISVAGTASVDTFTIVSNNSIEGAGVAIFVESALCNITNNTIDTTRGHGIQTGSTNEVGEIDGYHIICGNIIRDPGTATNDTYSGILVDSTEEAYDVICNNIITSANANKHKYGIREDTSAGPCIITGNVCLNAVTANISTTNGSTVSANNL